MVNTNDIEQLLLFKRGINNEFEVAEELTSINRLRETSTDEDIFKNISWKYLFGYGSDEEH